MIAVSTGAGISTESSISDFLLMNMSVRKWSKCGIDKELNAFSVF
jgi:NAD-dependent SIR2 family protein deacetylase